MDARLVADEADPAMAVRDEMGHRVLGAAEVVGDHDVRVDPAGRAVHEHGGYPGRDLRFQIAVVVGGRDDDQPVHPPGAQREHQLLFAARVLGAGAVDQQCAVVAGDFLDGAVERAVEGVGEILQHQADAGRTPLAQDPGGVVTAESQSGDGFLDASFGVRGDPWFAVDHAGDRLEADPGARRDILHRGPGAIAAGGAPRGVGHGVRS